MTHAAKLSEQRTAGRDRGGVDGQLRRVEWQRGLSRQGWQARLSAELEDQQPAQVTRIAGLVGVLALEQRIGAAPAGQHRDILLAVDLVGDGSRYDRRLDRS